jgi:chemotaxis protein MotB
MRALSKKTIIVLCILSFTVLSGCTDWKKKYENLNVAYKNLEGLLEHEKSQKKQLANELVKGQQTLSELQKKMAEQQSAAKASGFGEGYEVAFDPKAGTVTVTLSNAILFSSGKAELKKSTIAELDHIRSVLSQKYANRQVDVVGHTDTDPIKKSGWKDNWELSAERALSVVRYLIKQGISDDKIRAAGCGAARPVASNATVSGKAKNRRVEIVVYLR